MTKNKKIAIGVIIFLVAAAAVGFLVYSMNKKPAADPAGDTSGGAISDASIEQMEQEILATPDWKAQISVKAAQSGITEAQQLRKDAIWWLQQHGS